MFVGSSLSSIQMFKNIQLEDKKRFAIISTDKNNMMVKTSLAPGKDKKVAGSLLKKIQHMIFVVIDKKVVASFPDSFPNIYKDVLLEVKVFAMLFSFFHCESLRPWRVPTRLQMMLGSTRTSSPSWRSPTITSTRSSRTRSQTKDQGPRKKEEGPDPKPRTPQRQRSPSMTLPSEWNCD